MPEHEGLELLDSPEDIKEASIDELVQDAGLWLFLESQFGPGHDARLDAPQLAVDGDIAELRQKRDALLEALLEEPGKVVMAGILFLRHERYGGRISTSVSDDIDVFANLPGEGSDNVPVNFGTRSNYDSNKLDELYQIKPVSSDGDHPDEIQRFEYRYSALRRDYIFPRVFTIVVKDQGEMAIYSETGQFSMDEEGKMEGIVEEVVDKKTQDALVRQFLRASFEASATASARNEAAALEADEDAKRRYRTLGRTEPYLYHLA